MKTLRSAGCRGSVPARLLAAAFVLAACGVSLVSAVQAETSETALPTGSKAWHRFRGPNFNGISSETDWSAAWKESGPKVAWRAQLGEGYSTVSIVGDRLFTVGNRANQDTVWCLKTADGKEIWHHTFPCGKVQYPGPRATPTVDGSRVYTLSQEGRAFCLNAADGAVVWDKDLKKELGVASPKWGFAGSALILGDMVLYNVGDAGTALNKTTGAKIWTSGRGPSGYASPVPFKIGTMTAVAIFSAKELVVVEASSGRKLWSYPWVTSFDVNAADPIPSGNTIFISSGYNRGCALLKFDAQSVEKVYESKSMSNHFSTCVLLNGTLYGFSGNMGTRGGLVAMDYRTGAVKGTYNEIGLGSVIAAGGKLILMGERGELAIAEPSAGGVRILAKAKIMGGTCWTSPVLWEGRLYVRNHEGELLCLDLSGK